MTRLLPALVWTLAACVAAGQVERYQLAPGTARQAPAGTRAAERPHPAVVRVVATEPDGASYGSGTLIDVNDAVGLIVTNWHVVEAPSARITVIFPDGFRAAANVLKTDRDWDLAAIVCAKPRVAPVRLSRVAPLPGEMLTIAGYGKGDYRSASGRCTQYLAPDPKLPYEIVELEASARQGDSGGPIFNARGELAGVLFGHSRGLTSGSYCGRVDRFLKTLTTSGMTPPVESPKGLVPITRPGGSQSPAAAQRSAPPAADRAPPFVGEYMTVRTEPDPSEPRPIPTLTGPGAALPRTDEQVADWSDLVGRTPLERAKSAVIALVLLVLVRRVLGGDIKQPAKSEPLPID
ncbi:MAG TPA: serine protease [Pirellulales bacterium]|nr:serine protease [Pirellulales bacterium]